MNKDSYFTSTWDPIGSIISGLSGPGGNESEGILPICQIPGTGAALLNVISKTPDLVGA